MKKTKLIGGIAAAIIGGGLLWNAGSGRDIGAAGWETLNARVAQAVGSGPGVEAEGSPDRDGGKAAGKDAAAENAAAAADRTEQGRSQGAWEAATAPEENAATAGGRAVQGGGQGAGEPAASTAEAAVDQASAKGKVNVNTAGISELTSLPGIGEKKAQAILDYRKQHGAFHSASDLENVKGIGPKMLEKLKPYVFYSK
ncbi:ComEA family DNA-binding protein [Paenibacillus rhizophilus]|uniref:Helix-hairpin-helix domain-containing protein n=1 Tax=Paenibacillus rhizophilus TaxID=1850366 RepID=A0A3N9PZ84_9BACL|nr:helix-hairpin-helix domain-containing protein [Paenibacillus rhizophilus]RQW11722.1 helix-hairpin-helix domain-containing protein [Paenibacillus rhizophilus]